MNSETPRKAKRSKRVQHQEPSLSCGKEIEKSLTSIPEILPPLGGYGPAVHRADHGQRPILFNRHMEFPGRPRLVLYLGVPSKRLMRFCCVAVNKL